MKREGAPKIEAVEKKNLKLFLKNIISIFSWP